MKQKLSFIVVGLVILLMPVLVWLAHAEDGSSGDNLDAVAIGQAAGGTPQETPDGVVKVTWPRSDVQVQIDGLKMPPFMGLTSWAAFSRGAKKQAMVMGDMVLFQDEVNPAMDAAFAAGINVTALHNHFFFDQPKVYFMHIAGEGNSTDLAAGVRSILDAVREVRQNAPQVTTSFYGEPLPGRSTINAGSLTAILGGKPAEKDGMVKFTIGRMVKMPCGCEVGKEMGVNTWAAFYGSDENAVVDGDFATFTGELQPVLHAIRANGISIVAIHSHMEGDSPHVIFLHYWGRGPASRLAQGVKAALVAQEQVAGGR